MIESRSQHPALEHRWVGCLECEIQPNTRGCGETHDYMRHTSPQDDRLRRLHRVDTQKLANYIARPEKAPINIVEYTLPHGLRVWIVADGTHRVQSALERGARTIEYRFVDIRDAEREARNEGHDFHDLANRSRRFEVGSYDH